MSVKRNNWPAAPNTGNARNLLRYLPTAALDKAMRLIFALWSCNFVNIPISEANSGEVRSCSQSVAFVLVDTALALLSVNQLNPEVLLFAADKQALR